MRWAWWLDLNETLIRTGKVALGHRLDEQRSLERFVELCAFAGEHGGLDLLWVTGNTWEYARRVEEPLGLRLLPGVRWRVISENGMVAREGGGQLTWMAKPVDGWAPRVSAWLKRWEEPDRWSLQVNEARVTLKPVGNAFTPGELLTWGRRLEELDGWVKPWLHPFYLDLDPTEVVVDGDVVRCLDKAWAVRRMSEAGPRVCAVGDSASDLPMLREARARGGRGWIVANAATELDASFPRTRGAFTAGVVEALEQELSQDP